MSQMAQSKASETEKINTLYAPEIVDMAKSHIMYVVFKIFLSAIEKITCPKIKGHLSNLARIYAVHQLTIDSVSCYETGFFVLGNDQLLQNAFKKLMGLIRPQIIPLIESFGVSDSMIVSSIGNSYGDIYETQLEWARNSKLNKNPVAKGFKEYIQPILQGKL